MIKNIIIKVGIIFLVPFMWNVRHIIPSIDINLYVYNALILILTSILFYRKIEIKGYLYYPFFMIMSYELFWYLDFEYRYMYDYIYSSGNLFVPKVMYRDFKDYIDFRYIKGDALYHLMTLSIIFLTWFIGLFIFSLVKKSPR